MSAQNLEHIVQPLSLPSPFLGQLSAIPSQLPNCSDLRRRDEAPAQ
jgi:hypothetical protein